MNAICEAQLCQFVVVLQKVLKLQKKDHIQREAIIKCTTLMYHDIV